MDIKETFLKLTEWTVPHGYESTLEPILPQGLEKDEIGNYHMTIGESDTLFVCHLDTVSKDREKVNHVIEDNIIKTDGTTILGGDNKNGVVILMYMIEHGVPGTYYFFVGEEPPHSRKGSRFAASNYPEFFSKFKRVIAFDRKEDHSIITRQMAQNTCSKEFVSALQKQLEDNGLFYKPDPTGYYTDSASFLSIIPEVTNLSSGGWKEHTDNEYVKIDFVEKVANAAVHIDWESLPTVRTPRKKKIRNLPGDYLLKKQHQFQSLKTSKMTFQELSYIMSNLDYRCLDCDDEFIPGEDYTFSHWFQEGDIDISVYGETVTINGKTFKDLKEFKKETGITPDMYIDVEYIIDDLIKISERKDRDILYPNEIEKMLQKYYCSVSDLKYLLFKKPETADYIIYNPKKDVFKILV